MLFSVAVLIFNSIPIFVSGFLSSIILSKFKLFCAKGLTHCLLTIGENNGLSSCKQTHSPAEPVSVWYCIVSDGSPLVASQQFL